MTILPATTTKLSVINGGLSILDDWLATLSKHTQRAYRKDLMFFFKTMRLSMIDFLNCDRCEAFRIVEKCKGLLLSQEKSPAVVNRCLSALKSFVIFCYRSGLCSFDLAPIKSIKNQPYKDTTGVDLEGFKAVLNQCDCSTVIGVRDFAILSLFWGNGVRRGEVEKLKRSDFSFSDKKLRITGKGKKESQLITLSSQVCKAIQAYLELRNDDFEGLFISHHQGYFGMSLSGESLSKIVQKYSQKSGGEKKITPHKIRHSSITAALDATNGNLREVQKFSRHANINTLMIYDDNRNDYQGKISELLADLLI